MLERDSKKFENDKISSSKKIFKRIFKKNIPPMKTEKATFAAGCFWGIQKIFDTPPGVLKTTVGYCGGKKEYQTFLKLYKKETLHEEKNRVGQVI